MGSLRASDPQGKLERAWNGERDLVSGEGKVEKMVGMPRRHE